MFPTPIARTSPWVQRSYKVLLPIALIVWLLPLIGIAVTSIRPSSDLAAGNYFGMPSSFAGIEKTIPVTPGMKEWSITLPPMKASAEPKTLKVSMTIDGKLAHERIAEGIVFGDVWYVAAPTLALPCARCGMPPPP